MKQVLHTLLEMWRRLCDHCRDEHRARDDPRRGAVGPATPGGRLRVAHAGGGAGGPAERARRPEPAAPLLAPSGRHIRDRGRKACRSGPLPERPGSHGPPSFRSARRRARPRSPPRARPRLPRHSGGSVARNPKGPPQRGAPGTDRRAAAARGGRARVSAAARRGCRRGAAAARAQPPRRCPAAARVALALASARAGEAAELAGGGGRAARGGVEGARGRARGAPPARARAPPGCPRREGASGCSRVAPRPSAATDRVRRGPRRTAAGAGRGGRLLHRRGGAHEHRQVRPGLERARSGHGRRTASSASR